jgi:predicted phosphoribosyltransferase
MSLYKDRVDAGRQLGREVRRRLAVTDGAIVLALPRGGVPVAYEVARALGAPLDIFLVRKLGVPGREELAMGAIASGGVRVVNYGVTHTYSITPDMLDRVTAAEQLELDRRERAYRGNRLRPPLAGRTVILVDDGLATGASMRAAVEAVRAEKPARVIVAVPTGAIDTCSLLAGEADEALCLAMPEPFFAVGASYDVFTQTTDEEVRDLLDRAVAFAPSAAAQQGA